MAQEALAAAQAALAETVAARRRRRRDAAAPRGSSATWRVRDVRTQETRCTPPRRACARSRSSKRRARPTAKRRGCVLGSPEAGVQHHGSVADYIEVEPGGERAVEAAFGDLLQCVLVETPADADRGLAFVRDRGPGRCGFLSARGDVLVGREAVKPVGTARAIDAVVRLIGPHQSLIRWALGDVWVADDVESARQLSLQARVAVVTMAGELCRGGRLVMGGTREDSHGILTTRREVLDLAAGLATARAALETLQTEVAGFERQITETPSASPDSTRSPPARQDRRCSTSCTSRGWARS